MSAYFFLHCLSGRSWPTDDPHQWLLDHRDDELLAAARERLVDTPNDQGQCVREALRRHRLALVHVVSDVRIVVHHWAEPPPDMRVWAKQHGWNRRGIGIAFVNVKNDKIVYHEDGQDILLYGERGGPNFPWPVYEARYERRHADEPDDGGVAPASSTNFGWPTVTAGKITWRVLKSIWNAERIACLNCDQSLLLTSFSWHQMLSFRSARLARHCLGCRRRFDATEEKPLLWLASVLPPVLRPSRVAQWQTTEIDWNRVMFKLHRPVQIERRNE